MLSNNDTGFSTRSNILCGNSQKNCSNAIKHLISVQMKLSNVTING